MDAQVLDAWTRYGRPALFEALTEVCDRIGSQVAAELQTKAQARDDSCQQALQELRAESRKVARLESENAAQAKEIAALKSVAKGVQEHARVLEEQAMLLKVSHENTRATPANPLDVRRLHQHTTLHSVKSPSRDTPRAQSSSAERTIGTYELDTVNGSDDPSICQSSENYGLATDASEPTTMQTKYHNAKAKFKEAAALASRWKREFNKRADDAEKLAARIQKLENALERATASSNNKRAIDGTSKRDTAVSHDRVEGITSPPSRGHRSSPPSPSVITRRDPSASSTALHGLATRQGSSDVGGAAMDPRSPALDACRRAIDTESEQGRSDDSTQCDEGAGVEAKTCDLPPLSILERHKEVRVKREPSSDGPVVVSERSVKRQRPTGQTPDGPADLSRRIKLEPGSDPVVVVSATHFDAEESMDLDDSRLDLQTPRKRRFLSPSRHHEVEDHENPPVGPARGQRRSKRSIPTARPFLTRSGDGFWTPRTPLLPVSGNRRLAALGPAQPKDAQPEPRPENHPGGLVVDNKAPLGSASGKSVPDQEQTPTTEPRGRLKSMLNTPSSVRHPVLQRPVRQDGNRSGIAQSSRAPDPKALPLATGDLEILTAPSKSARPRRDLAGATTPRHLAQMLMDDNRKKNEPKGTPLRQRPLSDLKPGDFKINPRQNDGETYAYTEVVRNKADRTSLAGCVDPQCCGKHFRAMAISEMKAIGASLLSRGDSIALMEDYLGDEAWHLGSMPRKEKEDLWLEAKIRELADKYGKHRHRFHRRPSPPGFWNTDFPDTQEQLRDRVEAERLERVAVEERYREALRRGGRWLFRDEN